MVEAWITVDSVSTPMIFELASLLPRYAMVTTALAVIYSKSASMIEFLLETNIVLGGVSVSSTILVIVALSLIFPI